MMRLLANFFQHAYVTTDIARAKDIFAESYGVKAYADAEIVLDLQTSRGPGQAKLKLALAFVDALQIELIQPLGGDAAWIYQDALPSTGFGLVFHHVAHQVPGRIESWHEFRAGVGNVAHPIAIEGDLGIIKFLYLDAKARLGHYIEYIWSEGDMHAQVPRN